MPCIVFFDGIDEPQTIIYGFLSSDDVIDNLMRIGTRASTHLVSVVRFPLSHQMWRDVASCSTVWNQNMGRKPG